LKWQSRGLLLFSSNLIITVAFDVIAFNMCRTIQFSTQTVEQFNIQPSTVDLMSNERHVAAKLLSK